jgi:phosphate/sulfate permease
VANAVAPLATIYHIYQNDSISKKSDVPIWVLVLGGIGIVVGLSTWGYKIIDRIGRELTKISPSRGFIIELSAALTIIIASRAEIPVSTTHCQIGSVVGCGLVGGIKNIKWGILKKIVFSWLITLPITGFLSAGLFSYGYYSPGDVDTNILVNATL